MNLLRKKLLPPVKASMIIVRGLRGREVRGEDWDRVQHEVYTTLPPARCEGCDSVYELVLLVPGMAPIRSDATFYRGCNALAVPSDVVQYL
jgi:hypothetical protein